MLSRADKIRLLRDLTRGPDDVFAARGDDAWRPVYTKLTDHHIAMHLAGLMEIGAYPLIPNLTGHPMLWWVAADFDGKKPGTVWAPEVKRATSFLIETGACVSVNLSRSSKGAHVRVLFKEAVPAWVARRWMMAWLDEAGVVKEPGELNDDGTVPSFDRLIPPQDLLSGKLNRNGYRLPGNLIGDPLHLGLARTHGGTLPLDPKQAALGNFAPDGRHWDHVVRALESRAWGLAELQRSLRETPGIEAEAVLHPPRAHVHLPVVVTDDRQLDMMQKFCAFLQHAQSHELPYPLWVALATELHHFGEAGHAAFHTLSAADSRYDSALTDRKWEQTRDLHPVSCHRLVADGFRCPHLDTPRCGGATAPAFFAEHMQAEIL